MHNLPMLLVGIFGFFLGVIVDVGAIVAVTSAAVGLYIILGVAGALPPTIWHP